MAVASLVLGILSLLLSLSISWVGLGFIPAIVGIIGIILGVLARKKDDEKKGMATAGLVMSIIAVALGLITFLACAACLGSLAMAGSTY